MLSPGLAILVTSLMVCTGCSPNEMEVADTTGATKISDGASRTPRPTVDGGASDCCTIQITK